MKNFRWDPSKSRELKERHGVSFEEITQETSVTVLEHPKRPNQKLMLVERRNYIWVIPYVESEEEIFLKTLFPSRAYTRKWKRGEL